MMVESNLCVMVHYYGRRYKAGFSMKIQCKAVNLCCMISCILEIFFIVLMKG